MPYFALRTAVAFVLGGMSVAVRFTSLAAFVPVGVLLALQRPTLFQRIRFLIIPCALFGIVGIALSLFVDRCFYGFWAVPFLGSIHFNVIQGALKESSSALIFIAYPQIIASYFLG